MAAVEPPSGKVDKSKDFRSFLKAQAETKKPEWLCTIGVKLYIYTLHMKFGNYLFDQSGFAD